MCTPRNVAAFTVFGWRYAAYGSAVTQPAAHSDNLRNKTRPDDFISPRPSNSFSGFAFQLVAASIYSQILFLATAIFCSLKKVESFTSSWNDLGFMRLLKLKRWWRSRRESLLLRCMLITSQKNYSQMSRRKKKLARKNHNGRCMFQVHNKWTASNKFSFIFHG